MKDLKVLLFLFISMGIMFPTAFAFAFDSDNDGLDDYQESIYFTDPTLEDTDGDGFLDGEEINKNYSPHKGNGAMIYENDYDNDGLNDWVELWFGTSIGLVDTDSDGHSDYDEIMRGYDPKSFNTEKIYDTKIIVDRSLQRLYYYVDKIKMFNFPVSTGNPWTPTPAGEFTIERKIPVKRYVGPDYDVSGVKWNMQFKPMYYIHTAYWHNDFGNRTRSHGCVNVSEANAKMLYEYIDIGVSVEIIGETPKGLYVGT